MYGNQSCNQGQQLYTLKLQATAGGVHLRVVLRVHNKLRWGFLRDAGRAGRELNTHTCVHS